MGLDTNLNESGSRLSIRDANIEALDVVRFEIEEKDLSSCLPAAALLNISNLDIVCFQQHPGMSSGPPVATSWVFLRELRTLVVTSLPTILREPKADQGRLMERLTYLSTWPVVMAERGRQMLQGTCQARLAKIGLILHDTPDVGFWADELIYAAAGLDQSRTALLRKGDRQNAT